MDHLNILENMLQMWNLKGGPTDACPGRECYPVKFPETDYISQFKINGRPILPPLMTENRRKEMRRYRDQAVLREVDKVAKLQPTLELCHKSMQSFDAVYLADFEGNHEDERNSSVDRIHNSRDVKFNDLSSSSKVHSHVSDSYAYSCGDVALNSSVTRRLFSVDDEPALIDSASDSFVGCDVVKDNFRTHSVTKDIADSDGIFRYITDGVCELHVSPASKDTGLQSASYQTVSISHDSPMVAIATTDSYPSANASLAKSSIDSGVYSKDLISSCALDAGDHLEASLTLTLDEVERDLSNCRSDERVVAWGPDVGLESEVVGEFVDPLSPRSSKGVTASGALSLVNGQDKDLTATSSVQFALDDLRGSRSSNATALSVESLDSNKTIISCRGFGISSGEGDFFNCELNQSENDLDNAVESSGKDDERCLNVLSVSNENNVVLRQHHSEHLKKVNAEDSNKMALKLEKRELVEPELVCDGGFFPRKEDNDLNLENELVGEGKTERRTAREKKVENNDNQHELLQLFDMENKSTVVGEEKSEEADLYQRRNGKIKGRGEEKEQNTSAEDEANESASEAYICIDLNKRNNFIETDLHFSERPSELTEKMIVDLYNDNKSNNTLDACWLDGKSENKVVGVNPESREMFEDHLFRPNQRNNCELIKSLSCVSSGVNENLFGESIQSCQTAIARPHLQSIISSEVDLLEKYRYNAREDDVNVLGSVTPCSKAGMNSYVVSSSYNSPVAVDDLHLESSQSRQRRNSYTLDHPSEALLAANDSQILEVNEVNANPLLPQESSDDLVDPYQLTSLRLESDHISDQEASALAKLRARAESERVGKLEHLRRFLQQASVTASSRDEEEEFDRLNCSSGFPGGSVDPSHVTLSCDQIAACVNPVKTGVASSVGSKVTSQSSSDMPLAVSEEVLLMWLNREFERKKRLMEEEHLRHMEQLLAEQQLQQVALHREILRRQQNLRNRMTGGARTKTIVNSKPQKSRTEMSVINSPADGLHEQSLAVSEGARNSVTTASCNGVVDNRLGTPDSSLLSMRMKHPKVEFPLEAGDSTTIQDASAEKLYYERGTVDGLFAARQERSEFEPPYSLSMLRKQELASSNSTSSPQVPPSSDRRLRQQASAVGTPCSGGRGGGNSAVGALARLPDGDEQASAMKKLEKLPALVRGYLTRRLMKTERVLNIIQTIQDTAEFALHFQLESPMKRGFFSMQDRQLHDRVIAQLTAAMYEIHEIFFDIPVKERMNIIAQSRALHREKIFKESRSSAEKMRRISAATLKSIERKRKALESEAISKPPSQHRSRQTSEKAAAGTVAATRRSQIQRDARTGRVQLSPRKLGKENVHRILGREKTRIIASGSSSSRAKSANVKATKRSVNVPPTRKLARAVGVPQHENKFGSDVLELPAEGSSKVKQPDIPSSKSDPSSKAKKSESRLLGNCSEYLLVKDLDAGVFNRDSISQPTILTRKGENVCQVMDSNQRVGGVKSYSSKEREKGCTRKVARVQSRFS